MSTGAAGVCGMLSELAFFLRRERLRLRFCGAAGVSGDRGWVDVSGVDTGASGVVEDRSVDAVGVATAGAGVGAATVAGAVF